MSKSGSVLGLIRTVVLVTLVTALVWLLAESRTLRSQRTQVTIRLDGAGADGHLMRADPDSPWTDSVSLTLNGSAAGIDRVVRELQGFATLRLGTEVPALPGIHTIQLRDTLRQSELFVAAGVTVSEVNPEQVRVQVDAVGELELPVRVIAPGGAEFDPGTPPRAEPASVMVRGPASALAALEGTEASVLLDGLAIASLTPGVPEVLPRNRVDLPEGGPERWGLRVEPARVDVRVTLRSRTQRLELAAMPVQVLLAPGEVGRWMVAIEPGSEDLVGIEVTGPSDQIQRLRSQEVVPTAFVPLSFEELERGVESKSALIQGLPAGVTVSGGELTVRFSVSRAAPEPAGDTP